MTNFLVRFAVRLSTPLAIYASIMLTGCGMESSLAPAASSAMVTGIVHGGPNPVVGATVKLYSTGNTGYGSAATLLATASTDSNGSFSFPTNTCVAGSQVYVTAYGGDPGSGTNPNYLLLSALGDCSTISSATSIWMSEASTVASAFALRPFISISGTTVNIGAPVANNSSTPGCTGTGPAMTCTAEGLAHAFLNTLALVNTVSPTGTPAPTGAAYMVSPFNSKTSVPAALINSLANAIEACVNSRGGAAGDSSSCGNLFTNTTPPGGTAPANTLQALMNIAQYPTQNVMNIFNLASPTTFFMPALHTAPPDWSLALVHSGITVGATTTTFGIVYSLALDAADNVYVLSYKSPNTLLTSMTSNGAGSFVYSDSTYTGPRFVTTDSVGNIFFSNNKTSATNSALVEISNAGVFKNAIAIGAPYYAYGIAVDRYNNIYAANEYTASAHPTVYVVPAGSATATPTMPGGTQAVVGPYPHYTAVDPSGNVWTVADTTTASGGTFSTTLISNSAADTATPSFSSQVNITENASLPNGYGVTFDSAGNGWVNNYTSLYQVPVTPKSQVTSNGTTTVTPATLASTPSQSLTITGATGSGTVSAVAAEDSATDGANNIFLADFTGNYLWRFTPAATTGGTFVALQPCAAPNGATTCNAGTTAGTYPAIYTPEAAEVDSTGAVWVPDYSSSTVAQVLGVAIPTWPQISYGHPGTMPH